MKDKILFSVFCRSVGPGGTEVTFYPDKTGIIGIWSNENCPYSKEKEDGYQYEAEDGHNVSKINWEKLENALVLAIKKKIYEPSKLRLK